MNALKLYQSTSNMVITIKVLQDMELKLISLIHIHLRTMETKLFNQLTPTGH